MNFIQSEPLLKTILCAFIIVFITSVEIDGQRVPIVRKLLEGKPAPEGRFSFQVSLRIMSLNSGSLSRSFCSGTILSRSWIVTAAHCFKIVPDVSKLFIVAGDINNDNVQRPGRQVAQVKSKFIHQDYNNNSINGNDIALLLLRTPLVFTDLVSAIYLPKRYSEYTGSVVASGWGETENNTRGSDILLYTDKLKILPNPECKYNRTRLLNTQVCAIPAVEGAEVDVCRGDSGGPLTQTDQKGNPVILGIVSYGVNCNDPDPKRRPASFPGVYTKVSYYIDWIYKTVLESELK